MLGIGKKKTKFNLLFLEEGEHYIKNFIGTIKYTAPTIDEYIYN